MTRVTLLGATGMLGHIVAKELESEFKLDKWTSVHIDLSQPTNVRALAKSLKGKTVVNCCGMLRQRLNKSPTADEVMNTLVLNSLLPHELSKTCDLIHISSDCVFSGAKGNYVETDRPDELDVYGWTKAQGEPPNATVIRTSIIGKELNRNLGLYGWFMKQTQCNGFDNHMWNGVTTNQLAKIIKQLLVTGQLGTGIRHVFSNTVSKYDLLVEFDKHQNKKITINKITAPVAINRTLSTVYPEFNNSFNIPTLEEQIKEMGNS